MTVGESTANDTDLNILVKFGGCHGEVLQVLDHLEARERHTPLEISVSKFFCLATLGVGPGKNGRDDDKNLLLLLMLVQRLS